ncbi:hypothetical protein ILYODFUR_023305 [Ilyodon furcidens]|uniref:Uncharacterized protein n=1 Tax=Ilyodon furcidens TaxID=33524 RepID=A0ABV0T359_9TELE
MFYHMVTKLQMIFSLTEPIKYLPLFVFPIGYFAIPDTDTTQHGSRNFILLSVLDYHNIRNLFLEIVSMLGNMVRVDSRCSACSKWSESAESKTTRNKPDQIQTD